ncbi:MAG TPA: four helix bundle protein [Vicinamibacterales bacterium]
MPKSHTELICWQLADQLRQLIIAHTADGTAAARDFRFTSNLRDAIASACRNQSEGFYKYKHKPQRPFFNTARASLGEAKDGIEDGRERGYFSAELAKRMENLCGRAMIANLRWLKSLDHPDPEDEP